VAVLPETSFAVIASDCAAPAVCVAEPVIVKVLAAPAFITTLPELPVLALELVAVKVPELGAPRQVRLAFRKTGERRRAAEAFLEVVRSS